MEDQITPDAPHEPLEAVHAATHALLATLDGDDVDAIGAASADVSRAIQRLATMTTRDARARELLEGALDATESARVRLKLLEDSTARKLVAMARLSRHLPSGGAYDRSGRIAFAKDRGRA